jgi:tetratricopeptide (TPR) repeat protein
MFYLLSALAMPLREGYRHVRGLGEWRRWRLIAAQVLLAVGILGGLWVTGWLLGLVEGTIQHYLPAAGLAAGAHPRNVLRTAALVLSLGTLGAVLLGVQVLRLCVRPIVTKEEADHAVAPAMPRRRLVRALVILFVVLGMDSRALAQVATRIPHTAGDDSALLVATHLARADSAYKAGQRGLAAREYSLVLATDPANSHATFRLAQLLRADPAQSLRLYQRYVALEPSDAWGHMALGDALARAGRFDEALRAYDQASRLAPRERDAIVGRARLLLRAGRPGDAARALEQAQALGPDRAIADRLARARAIAAPAITPLVGGSRDSDGNRSTTLGGSIDLAAQGTWRLGMSADRERVEDGLTATGVDHLVLRATWQPRATVKIDAAGGATRMDAIGTADATTVPTGQARVRWRAPGSGPALDLRAQRSMLDGTPLLVANRVSRAEVGALAELPLSRVVRLRGLGRTAELSDSAEVNHRTTYAGMIVCAVKPGFEISGQFHATRYAHASDAGYFAPALIHVAEIGSYIEVETARGLLVAFDLGGGVQQVAEQGASLGPWKPALRLYSLIVWPIATGRELRLEVDAENSPVASEVATAGGTWRYGAATLSLRWALP